METKYECFSGVDAVVVNIRWDCRKLWTSHYRQVSRLIETYLAVRGQKRKASEKTNYRTEMRFENDRTLIQIFLNKRKEVAAYMPIAQIRITSPDKAYELHSKTLGQIHFILNYFGLSYTISKAEFFLDFCDLEGWKQLSKMAILKNNDLENVQFYDEKKKKQQKGYNPDTEDQYQGFRNQCKELHCYYWEGRRPRIELRYYDWEALKGREIRNLLDLIDVDPIEMIKDRVNFSQFSLKKILKRKARLAKKGVCQSFTRESDQYYEKLMQRPSQEILTTLYWLFRLKYEPWKIRTDLSEQLPLESLITMSPKPPIFSW